MRNTLAAPLPSLLLLWTGECSRCEHGAHLLREDDCDREIFGLRMVVVAVMRSVQMIIKKSSINTKTFFGNE